MMCKLHTFAAVTRYTPTAGLGLMHGPLLPPPTAVGEARRRSRAGELHQRDGAARARALASPCNRTDRPSGPARRGSKTRLSNVIKTRII